MVIPFLLMACASGDKDAPTVSATDSAAATTTAGTPPTDEMSTSTQLAWLTRASLDLRGVRPTTAEISELESDPDALASLIDDFLDDPRLEDQIVSLYAEVFLTSSDTFQVPFDDFDLDPSLRPVYLRSVGEEPLRILARIAVEDLPYTDLVTADWTVTNELLGQIWPIDYPAGAQGWQVTQYTDGRPAAGMLSTNGMWWRFTSTDSNQNRKRANQISRILLCHDYLTRPIDFDRDIDLFDEDAIADAIQNNPGCVNCHVSLDPLASHLYGFWHAFPDNAADTTNYHPERELYWKGTTGVEPAYYGQTSNNLTTLGHHIAGDPRFIECAVEQAFTRMMRRETTLDDTNALTVHREAFLDGALRLKPLLRSIVTHPRYAPQTSTDEATVPGQATRKMLTPEQLARQVADLTGFTWSTNGYDMFRTDTVGVGNLAGRADGVRMTRHAPLPNTTQILVMERLAEAASAYAVSTEAAQADEDRRLFKEVDFTDTPETNPTSFTAQIQALHLRVLSRQIAADGPEVDANTDLWNELFATEADTYRAWAGVLCALMRDPDFILY